MGTMKVSTKNKIKHWWRRFVIWSGQSCPVHDPSWSMAVAVLLTLIGVIFLFAGMSLGAMAEGFPLFARVLHTYPLIDLGLRIASFAIMLTAFWQGWRHNARCLIDCYPKFFDPYEQS